MSAKTINAKARRGKAAKVELTRRQAGEVADLLLSLSMSHDAKMSVRQKALRYYLKFEKQLDMENKNES